MYISDIVFVFQWWLTFFVIGIIFLPITNFVFASFFDKGYIFSKIIGIALASYIVFILGILKILPFNLITIDIVLIVFFTMNIFLFVKVQPLSRCNLKTNWKIFVFEEILFILTLFFWSFIRGHQPDIHGLEKYMDFGFINSILRSEYFPPKDMWFTPFSINYYYFGHLVTAVLTKLSVIPSSVTFNLMLSTIFAFTFTAGFSIGANLFIQIKSKLNANRYTLYATIAGLLTAFLVSLAGNLHAIYSFFKPYANENPVPFWQLAFSPNSFPNSYWYPNATRFIHNTIHEFPIYSSVVSDLHGHYLDVPFVLLTIAVLLSLIFNFKFSIFNQIKNLKNSNSFQISNFKFQILLISFLLAVMYMTNAWDGIIYFLLAALVLLFLCVKLDQPSPMEIKNGKLKIKNSMKIENLKLKIARWLFYISIVIVVSILFSLPFSINFKPFASGIGILCGPEFLTNIGKLGPFLFEKDHCQHSPIWQLFILYGFFYFWVVSFIIMLFKTKNQISNIKNVNQKLKTFKNLDFIENLKLKIENLNHSDIFILLLIGFSTLLIILPEFIYVKDIYPAHYRANTMFKLVYQSFIMLSLSSGYIIIRILNWKLEIGNWKFIYFLIGSICLLIVFLYPYFAINSYYDQLRTYHGLDGTTYLKTLYPTDYQAILWINKNIKGQPVILEAQGDSYTDHARVSTNTGLPTVLGWTVHEWLWRGAYDIPAPRIPEVQKMYESKDIKETKQLLKKYNVSLLFIGQLEKQKYSLNEEKFKSLGKIIYQNGNTKIYKII